MEKAKLVHFPDTKLCSYVWWVQVLGEGTISLYGQTSISGGLTLHAIFYLTLQKNLGAQ
jgi:hypothetical protein